MIIQLIGVNSKYIHPANGVFQLVANSNYPVQYFEATIKDSLSDIISKVNPDADLIGLSVYIWNINIIVEKDICLNVIEFSSDTKNYLNVTLNENSRLIYNKIGKNVEDKIKVLLDGEIFFFNSFHFKSLTK